MTTVLVWNNHLRPIGNSFPGHASVSIDDNWASDKSYVSWLPGDDHKIFREFGRAGASISTDLMFEKYAPDHIIRITGMDVMAMMSKWNEVRSKENAHYRYTRKNCSTIASRVLKAGSAQGGLKRHHIIWTPLMVKRLALEMGGTTMLWTDLLQECRQRGHLSPGDVLVLQNLHKRDERSGSSMTTFHYSRGAPSQPKTGMLWGNRQHHLHIKDGGRCYVSDGTLMNTQVAHISGTTANFTDE
ncbi:hypothetical protein EOD42_20080 [Rhodovarius crocodyli]|uniref:Uncharacterized protein n=1 Tax=Rhodovarius crocodyli TaxID=1979269 RepID=A0A437M3A0_9PROT|nr:hypothetical protein [Rhodovarius crocodyli]RVT92035.1 hypothetical protein EOD42_20080 [Rhodovarius crocodyli]